MQYLEKLLKKRKHNLFLLMLMVPLFIDLLVCINYKVHHPELQLHYDFDSSVVMILSWLFYVVMIWCGDAIDAIYKKLKEEAKKNV